MAINPAAIAMLFAGKVSPDVAGAASVATSHVDSNGITLARMDCVDTDNLGLVVNAHHKDSITDTGVAATFSFGIITVDAGVCVYKVTDNAKTISLLENSNITHDSDDISNDKVTATNDITLSSKEYTINAGIGLGITAGVAVWRNNFTSTAQAKINNTNIGTSAKRANRVDVVGITNLNETFSSVEGNLGVITVGVNKVRNTINTTTAAETAGSGRAIYAKDIDVKGIETRNVTDSIWQVSVGALNVFVGDVVTNVGTAGTDNYIITYSEAVTAKTIAGDESLTEKNVIECNDNDIRESEQKADTGNRNLRSLITNRLDEINAKLDDRQQAVGNSEVGTMLTLPYPDGSSLTPVTAGVHSDVKNITLNAANDINVATETKNNIFSNSNSFRSLVNVGVVKNFVNLHQNNGVSIEGAALRADGNIFVGNTNEGSVKTFSVDAKILGALSVSVIESSSKRDGETKLEVRNSKLLSAKGTGDVTVRNKDTISLLAQVASLDTSIISGGYLEAETKDTSTMSLSVTGDSAGSTAFYGKRVSVENVFAPNIISQIIYPAGTVAKGQGTLATSWLGNDVQKSGANAPVNVALHLEEIDLFADRVDIVNGLSDEKGNYAALTAKEGVVGIGALDIGVNKGRTTANVNVKTDVKNVHSNLALAENFRKNNSLGGTLALADWNVISLGALQVSNIMENVEVGVGICSATNYTRNHVSNGVTLDFAVAEGETLEAKNLTIEAKTVETGIIHVKSNDGGIIAISPVAAGLKNDSNFWTTLNLSCKYVVLGAADMQSEHKNGMRIYADGHSGNILGGSAVKVYNTAVVDNATNVRNAEIVAGGSMTVKSTTQYNLNKDVAFEGDNRSMLYASNKGGVAGGEGSNLDSSITINDNTNIADSKLRSQGQMLLEGYGNHEIYVVQSAVSSSVAVGANETTVKSTINETDRVTTSGNTEIVAAGKDADLYVVASNGTSASVSGFSEQTFSLVAAGAACYVTDNITRNNIINIGDGSHLYSGRDTNIFANLDEKRVMGSLSLDESSRTFASGIITVPYSRITSNLNQTNQVTLAEGAKVDSFGNVNIYANYGRETIDRKTGSYCWYKNNLQGEFMSTSASKPIASIMRNNFVDVKGAITAGTLNSLTITIGGTGSPVLVVPDAATKAMFASSGYTVYTIDDYEKFISFGIGNEEFKEKTGIGIEQLKPILVTAVGTENQTLQKLYGLMGDYSTDGANSRIYKTLKSAADLLEQQVNKGTSSSEPGVQRLSENLCVVIPDILVSGGNVNIETGVLRGNGGNITAKGMRDVSITNNSSMMLKVNNITVVNPGGNVNFNEITLPETGYLKRIRELNTNYADPGNFSVSSSQATVHPEVKIEGKWGGSGVSHSERSYKLTDYRRNSDGSIVLDGNGNPVVVYLKKVDGKYVETTETEADTENVAAGKVLCPADVYVVGGIENLDGSVSVVSDHNNIVISSTDGAGIRAAQVLVKAEHGSLVQLSPNQTINIDGSPEAIYGEVVNNAVNWLKSKDHLYKEGNVVLEIIDWDVAERNGYMSDALATWYNNLSQEDKSQLNNGYIKIDGAYVKVSSTYSTVTDLIKLQQQHKPYYEYLQSSWVNRYDKPQKFVWVNRVGNPMGTTMEKPAANPNDGDPAKSGYIMGSDITLVGADININGIVQSGYAKYQLNLTDADEDRINLIKASHLSGGGKPLTDAEVLNNEQFLVRKGGAVYDAASGSYRYEVAAYYNPDEDTVVVPSVNAEGGNIFLAGRIASTGNGKIICMDGVSTIDVKNTYNHSLALNDLLVGERQGKVTIVDAGLEKSVEIARDGITAKAFDGVVDFNTDQVKYNASTGVYKYYPKENLKYEWVSGDDYSEVKTYLTTKRATWWGWNDYKKYGPDVLKSTDPDTRLIGVQPPAWKPRTDGSFIVEDSFFKDQNSLQVTRTYNSGTSVKSQPKPGRSYTTGLYGCHKWQEYTWEEKNGYSFTNQVKMRADLPVQILFIGQQNAKQSFVNITNEGQNKTVKLYGDIGNTKLYEAGGVLMENGNVNITSKGGIERLGGEIYARNVDLSAVGDISGVQVRVADAVNLDAWSILAGSKVSVNVNKNYLSAGTVNVGAFGGKDGNNASVAFAQLITQGDVLRADSAKHNDNESMVVAGRINIVSSEGNIGAADKYLNIRGGQVADSNNSMSASVNVDARGDIYLCQTAGSLRAGRIASKSGDLFIEVPDGGILDAQSIFGQDDRPGYKQDLLSEWAALGLIDDGSDLAKKQIAMKDEAIQRERDLLISERDAVATTKDRIAEIDVELQNLAADKTKQETSHRDVIASLDSIINGKGTPAEKDAAKKLKAEFESKWSGYWTNYQGEYSKKVADLTAERNFTGASEERKAEINKQLALLPEKYQVWNGEQMLYAMENSIINPEAGYTATPKDPNLYGRNINLKVRDNVGILEDNVQIISSLDLYEKNSDGTFKNIDKIRALSWADKGSATYNNDRKEFTLVTRVGLGLQQSAGAGGKIVVTGYDASDNYANGSVFIEGRKFQDGRSGQDLDLAFEMVKAEGPVRLISLANLINVAKPQQPVVITKGNLFLSTGDEIITDKGFSIGNADNLFTVQAAGNVQLLATGDIYLRTFGDLNMLCAVAGREEYGDIGGNICLTSDGNIYGVYVDGQDVQGNIRSGNGKNITLDANGSIGDWDDDKKTVRFKNVDDTSTAGISLTAKDEVVVEGVSTAMALPEKLDNQYQVPAQGKLSISKLETKGNKVRITVNGKLDLKESSFDFGLNDSEFDVYSAGNLQFDSDVTAAKVVLSDALGVGLSSKITGKDVILQTGVVPVLTAGVLSVVTGDGHSYADITNHSSDTAALTGEVKAVNLTVKADRDIDLGGTGKIWVDNADLSATNNVIFKNYSVSGLQPGNTDATVKVHSGEKMLNGRVEVTFGEGNNTFTTTPQTLTSNDVLAKGDVLLNSRGNLINAEGTQIYSAEGIVDVVAHGYLINKGSISVENVQNKENIYVFVGAGGNLLNTNAVSADNGYIIITGAGALDNSGNIDSNGQSIGLLAGGKISNTALDRFITADKDVVMCAGDGLENNAKIAAGVYGTSGGDVVLDDFEAFNADGLVDSDFKFLLENILTAHGYKPATEFKSDGTVHNSGSIVAQKGTADGGSKGHVHLDSQGHTENEGDVYSIDGAVFMDSTEDLVNNGSIYVLNSDTTGAASCNVTLQATGNLFNSGDIYVVGKGEVALDADAMDRNGLDYAGMTEEQIASHLKTSTVNEVEFKGVYNTGDIYVTNGDVTLKTMYGGDIYNDDDFRTEGESVIASSGSISLLAPYGIVENTKTLVSGKNITIESYQDIYNLPAGDSGYVGESVQRGLETLNGTITLISHGKLVDGSQLEGLVVNKGILKANNGDIVIVANGSVKTDALPELEDIIPLPKELYAGITYSFLNDREGDILTTDGNVRITANQSVVSFGDMMALIGEGGSAVNGDISLRSNNGNVVIYSVDEEYKHVPDAHSFVADGDMSLRAPKGYVYSDKGMYAKGDLTLEFGAGEQSGEVISDSGNVTFISRGVDEKFRDLTISNHISAANGKVTIVSCGNLTINDLDNMSSGIVSKNDIVLDAEKNIKIIDATDIRTAEGGIEIQSNSGDIDVTGPVNAKGFVRLYTKGGTADSRAWISDENEKYNPFRNIPESDVYPQYSAGQSAGNITINGAIGTNGDVDLSSYDGNITVQNIIAGKMAVVGTHSGKIDIEGKIKGNDVALYSEADQVDISFGDIDVTNNLILAGNNWNVNFNDIKMGENVNLFIYGACQSKSSTGNFIITYHKGSDKPLHFSQLSAATVTIDTEGPLVIDNLNIGDRAEFYVMGTKTDIFGKVHDYDKEARSIYFSGGDNSSSKIDLSPVLFGYDAARKQEETRKLATDPHQFEVGGFGTGGSHGKGGKVSYEKLTPETETCNAYLLKKSRNYDVYGQRYSMESLMQNLGSIRINNVFDAVFNTNIQFFTRYNTITIPDVVVNEPSDLKKDEFEF
ncbi:MAG: hypothetical protein MJ041_01160 [Acidaminococcaceae bacterium]|nr:hypothetical protein [Acidaminococcaceae bacterium]